jgi:6-phosphofructokinase
MLGRSVDHIEGTTDFDAVMKHCRELDLSALVLIGGTRTATDAAYLSEYCLTNCYQLKIVTVPVDISGALHGKYCKLSAGFDTFTKVSAL